jgi:hypothetical protein
MINDKSFQLLRTNPALTGNVKVVVDSDYDLYLESYNSIPMLNRSEYKHKMMTEDDMYDLAVSNFFYKLSPDIVFSKREKMNLDSDSINNRYYYQYDPIYFSGGKNIEDQWYNEEFEYNAPLYIRPNNLPESFVILRVDDPAIFNKETGYDIDGLNKDNFRSEIIDKWKAVKSFDLTNDTKLGSWVDKNFRNNKRYPNKSFEFSADIVTNSTWYGVDYRKGCYSSKKSFTYDFLSVSQPHYKLENYVTNGFKNNGIIYPHIVNFKFLFDDTPADPFKLKKYSLNRYYGFYIEQIDTIKHLTSYDPPNIVSGITIVNNIFVDENDVKNPLYPFEEEYDENLEYYIYAKTDLYKVIRVLENDKYVYKILSDVALSVDDINKDGIIDIEYSQNERISYDVKLKGRYSNLDIDSYINRNDEKEGLYGDLYLLEVDGKDHVLKYDDNYIVGENNTGGTILSGDTPINDMVGDLKYLYVADNSGLTVYNWEGEIMWQGNTSNSDLPSNKVNTLYLDNNILYAGTENGIWIKDFNTLNYFGNVKYNTSNTNLPSNNITKIYFKDNIVVATSGSTIDWWINYPNLTSGYTKTVSDANINSFSIDDGDLFIAEGKRIRKYLFFNPEQYLDFSYESNIFLPNAEINDILIKDDIFYVGTDDGFWLKNGPFEKVYNSTTGFDIGSNQVKKIQTNIEDGIIYLTLSGGTDGGIYYLNYFDNIISQQYTTTGNSLQENLFTSVIKPGDSEIAVGGYAGFQIFNTPINSNSTGFNAFDYYLNTDYAINSNSDILEYWIQDRDSEHYVSKSTSEGPIKFAVKRLKFCDIKDFDFDRIDTKYSEFDYRQNNIYTQSDEHKLYTEDLKDKNVPKDWRTYKSGINQYKIMNISSEYIANNELWELNDAGTPTTIWSKNPTSCKWGFQNSISHSDNSYKLNVSYQIGSKYNRTTGLFETIPDSTKKNLDYFYRVGELTRSGNTSDIEKYHFYNQATNIETSLFNEDSRKFNLELYLSNDFDYFNYFFDNYMNQRIDNNDENIKSTTKFSLFNNGGQFTNSSTLFNGIKYEILNVEDIVYDEKATNTYSIKDILTDNTTNFNGYKFSVIFNPAYYYQDSNGDQIDNIIITPYRWYNPLYLEGYDFQGNKLNPFIRGYNKASNDGIVMEDSNYSGLTYYQEPSIRVSLIFSNEKKEDEILYLKKSGKLFYKSSLLTGTTTNPISTDYSNGFSNTDTLNEYVFFSGSSYYDENRDEISQFYELSAGTSETFINLIDWDEDDFISNWKSWKNNSLLYMQDGELFNGSIYDWDEVIDNSKVSINVFLNEEYKNCLVIVNSPVLIKSELKNLNNTDSFGFNHGLYYGNTIEDQSMYVSGFSEQYVYNPSRLVAINYAKTLNDIVEKIGFDSLNYYYVNSNGYTKYEMSGTTVSPFILKVKNPEKINLYKNPYNIIPLKGPSYDVYNVEGNVIDYPLSVVRKEKDDKTLKADIYRYGGEYEPIFKKIQTFNKVDYKCDCSVNSRTVYQENYRFDDTYTNFGTIDEIVYSKINENGSVLKLADKDNSKSYYPMIDEYGYSVSSKFIFKSSWDNDFFIRTTNNIKFNY